MTITHTKTTVKLIPVTLCTHLVYIESEKQQIELKSSVAKAEDEIRQKDWPKYQYLLSLLSYIGIAPKNPTSVML